MSSCDLTLCSRAWFPRMVTSSLSQRHRLALDPANRPLLVHDDMLRSVRTGRYISVSSSRASVSRARRRGRSPGHLRCSRARGKETLSCVGFAPSADLSSRGTVRLRPIEDAAHSCLSGRQEIVADSGLLVVVPASGLLQLGGGFRMGAALRPHLRRAARSARRLAKTSSVSSSSTLPFSMSSMRCRSSLRHAASTSA